MVNRVILGFINSKSAVSAVRSVISLRGMGSASTSTSTNMANMDQKQIELMREMCICVDQNDKVIEGRSKLDCHLMDNINNGLLHRAFSVLLFNSNGEFLLTQRSDVKITFPGYFTNACCSHPLYNELEMDENNAIGVKRAAQRRLEIELGVDPLHIPLEDFKYMTRLLYKVPSDGIWGEHELDYALIIQKDVTLNPDPNEVKSYKYISRDNLLSFLKEEELKGNPTSPWFKFIVDSFLFEWWKNLNCLQKFQDHNTIHRLT